MLSLRMEIPEIYAWIACLGMRGSGVLWARLNQRSLFDGPNSAFRAPVQPAKFSMPVTNPEYVLPRLGTWTRAVKLIDLLVRIEHRHL
jgi:hypothetical protein